MKINSLAVIFVLLGFVLLIFEMFFFTSYLFPLGVGLILSGIYLFFFKETLGALTVFFFSAVFLYILSFKYARSIKGFRNVLEELKNQKGIVIGKVDDFTYKVRFPLGAGGEEVWNAYSKEELRYGDKVEVVGVRGNKLVVKKVVDA